MKKRLLLLFSIFRKEFLNQTGIKLTIVYIVLGSFFEIIIYYFNNNFIDPVHFKSISNGFDYFSYVLVGYCYVDIFTTCTISPGKTIAGERMQGTFEAFVLSPYSLFLLLLLHLIPDLTKSFLRIVIFIAIGLALGFKGVFSASIFMGFGCLIFSSFLMFAIGIFFASLTLTDRRLFYVTGLYVSISAVFSGAFYPLNVLPDWVIKIFFYTPFTYTMNALRNVFSGINDFYGLVPIVILAPVTVILSYHICNFFENYAKRKGSILKY